MCKKKLKPGLHINKVHKGTKYMCTECKVIVTTNLIQDKHTREVHEDTVTSVPSVNKYSNTRDRLREKRSTY